MLVDTIAKLTAEFRPVSQLLVDAPRAVNFTATAPHIDAVAAHEAVERQLLIPYRTNKLRRRKTVGCAPVRDVPVVMWPIFRLCKDVEHHVINEIVDIDALRDRLICGLAGHAGVGEIEHGLPVRDRPIDNNRRPTAIIAYDYIPGALGTIVMLRK